MTDIVAQAVDAIDLEVVKASLGGIVQEMQNSLFRTGFSTIVRESQDASCALMNERGEVVAQHVVLPLHIGAFPACCAAVLETFGDTIAAGRRLPDQSSLPGRQPPCARHGGDHAGLRRRPRCSASAAASRTRAISAARCREAVPARRARSSTKACKFRRCATKAATLPTAIWNASSPPTAARRSWCSATSAASSVPIGSANSGLIALVARHGAAKIRACYDRLFEMAKARLRRAVADWKDGRHEAERFVDDDGIELERPVRIHVVVDKHGDDLHFDFTASADQTKGPANIRPPLVQAACAYCLISLIDPHIYVCSGLLQGFSITAREGSVLDPRFPAPVNTYNPTVHALVDAIFAALSQCRPARRAPTAAAAGPSFSAAATPTPAAITSSTRSWRAAPAPAPPRTARPASRSTRATRGSRRSRSSNPNSRPGCCVSTSFRDSGGAGRHRGGLGLRREYLNLADARFSIRSMKHVIPPHGCAGGRGRAHRRHRDQSGQRIRQTPADALRGLSVAAGRRVPPRHPGRRRLWRSAGARARKGACRRAGGLYHGGGRGAGLRGRGGRDRTRPRRSISPQRRAAQRGKGGSHDAKQQSHGPA